jgi:uncharacterized protein
VTRAVTCPQCGKPVEPSDKKWLPFCSERCKLADLGHWFSGRYSIPAEPDPDAEPPATPDQDPRS